MEATDTTTAPRLINGCEPVLDTTGANGTHVVVIDHPAGAMLYVKGHRVGTWKRLATATTKAEEVLAADIIAAAEGVTSAAEAGHPEFVPGHEFVNVTDHAWSTAEGENHRHRFTTRCRVTGASPSGFDYEVVEVLAEEDAPPAEIRRGCHTRGSMAWFAIDHYTDNGTMWTVEA